MLSLPPSRTQRFVETPDGVRVSLREWGSPAGRPILFVHGVAQCHLAFVRQFTSADLAPFRLFAFDVRGHGESDKPDDISFYDDHRRWADELHAVIGSIGEKPLVVGWSMGGRIIGQYLGVHGDDAVAGFNFVASRVVVDDRFQADGLKGMPATPEHPGIAHDIASAGVFLRACFHRRPSPEDYAAALAYNMVAWPRVKYLSGAWPRRAEETTAALRRVKVPTLVTHGDRDALVAPGAAELTRDLVPGATLSFYEDCGHSPFHEHAERFNRELAAFARAVFR